MQGIGKTLLCAAIVLLTSLDDVKSEVIIFNLMQIEAGTDNGYYLQAASDGHLIF